MRFCCVLVIFGLSLGIGWAPAAASAQAEESGVPTPSASQLQESEESARIRRQIMELRAQGDAAQLGHEPLGQAIRALDAALQRERNQDPAGAERAQRIAEAALLYARHKIARARSEAALEAVRERRRLIEARLERARRSSP